MIRMFNMSGFSNNLRRDMFALLPSSALIYGASLNLGVTNHATTMFDFTQRQDLSLLPPG